MPGIGSGPRRIAYLALAALHYSSRLRYALRHGLHHFFCCEQQSGRARERQLAPCGAYAKHARMQRVCRNLCAMVACKCGRKLERRAELMRSGAGSHALNSSKVITLSLFVSAQFMIIHASRFVNSGVSRRRYASSSFWSTRASPVLSSWSGAQGAKGRPARIRETKLHAMRKELVGAFRSESH